MPKKLKREFYQVPALKLARNLLGKYLVRKIGKKKLSARIIETEAYVGPKDRASHSFGWKIGKRNKTEYLEGGRIYIYLCYGLHWQFNIVASLQGKPECVLIRALENEQAKGPGKLCRWLELDKSFDGEDLACSGRIWLEDRSEKKPQVVAAKRVGIDYAGSWAEKPWRFYVKGNAFISRK